MYLAIEGGTARSGGVRTNRGGVGIAPLRGRRVLGNATGPGEGRARIRRQAGVSDARGAFLQLVSCCGLPNTGHGACESAPSSLLGRAAGICQQRAGPAVEMFVLLRCWGRYLRERISTHSDGLGAQLDWTGFGLPQSSHDRQAPTIGSPRTFPLAVPFSAGPTKCLARPSHRTRRHHLAHTRPLHSPRGETRPNWQRVTPSHSAVSAGAGVIALTGAISPPTFPAAVTDWRPEGGTPLSASRPLQAPIPFLNAVIHHMQRPPSSVPLPHRHLTSFDSIIEPIPSPDAVARPASIGFRQSASPRNGTGTYQLQSKSGLRYSLQVAPRAAQATSPSPPNRLLPVFLLIPSLRDTSAS